MKKLSAMLIITALLFSGCLSNPADHENSSTLSELIVLHTNDHHGAIEAKDGFGGLAQRATYIKNVRENHGNVLLLDAGDINTGSAISNRFKAEPDILAYNEMRYDAVAFGNHEFDHDLETLNGQMKLANFPFLAANLKKEDGNYLGKPYIIVNYEGFRVGVFGLITSRTPKISNSDKTLYFTDEIKAAKEMVQRLKDQEKASIIIALTHLGLIEEEKKQITSIKLAKNVSGIDLIVDGHSHSKLETPLFIQGTPIVSANMEGKFIGQGKIILQGNKIKTFSWCPVAVDSKDLKRFSPHSDIQKLLDPYMKKTTSMLKETIAKTSAVFEFGAQLSRKKETSLGDLICDALVWYTNHQVIGEKVDFCIQNGGNIRSGLPFGDVTEEDLASTLPFKSSLQFLSLTGRDVIALFDHAATLPQGSGEFLQVSKEVRYTLNYENNRIENLTIHDRPVEEDKIYRIVTNDFLADGRGGYHILKERALSPSKSEASLQTAVIHYLKQLEQPIIPVTDGRITIIGGMQL